MEVIRKYYDQLENNNSDNNNNACGVMVIIIGNGHGDMSSNPRRGWLHFT